MDAVDVLPFPKSEKGWFVTIVVILFGFWLYYVGAESNGGLYARLNQAHEDAFSTVVTSTSQTPTTENILRVWVRVPNHVASLRQEKIYVTVQNIHSDMIDISMLAKISDPSGNVADELVFLCNPSQQISPLDPDAQDQDVSVAEGNDNSILILSLGRGEMVTKEICVRPYREEGQKVTFNLSLQEVVEVDDQTDILRDVLELENDPNVSFGNDDIEMTIVARKSLARSAVGMLLLPPWANGFIPLFALILTYLLEQFFKDTKGYIFMLVKLVVNRFFTTESTHAEEGSTPSKSDRIKGFFHQKRDWILQWLTEITSGLCFLFLVLLLNWLILSRTADIMIHEITNGNEELVMRSVERNYIYLALVLLSILLIALTSFDNTKSMVTVEVHDEDTQITVG